jgi:hypothetical protein
MCIKVEERVLAKPISRTFALRSVYIGVARRDMITTSHWNRGFSRASSDMAGTLGEGILVGYTMALLYYTAATLEACS